jgi:hypothetical protein
MFFVDSNRFGLNSVPLIGSMMLGYLLIRDHLPEGELEPVRGGKLVPFPSPPTPLTFSPLSPLVMFFVDRNRFHFNCLPVTESMMLGHPSPRTRRSLRR